MKSDIGNLCLFSPGDIWPEPRVQR